MFNNYTALERYQRKHRSGKLSNTKKKESLESRRKSALFFQGVAVWIAALVVSIALRKAFIAALSLIF